MKFGSSIISPSDKLSWTVKSVRHNETRAPTLPYLLKFLASPPFSAASGQTSYARVCFQGICMKTSDFLNLVFQHRASHIPEAAVATYSATPPSLPAPFKSIFSSTVYFFLVMNSYLCLLELLSFHFSEKRHQTTQKPEPLPVRVPPDIAYRRYSPTPIKDSEPPLQ